MPSEVYDDTDEIVARLNQLIDNRCRVTDEDFKSGLPSKAEEAIIERLTEAGYSIGMDEDHRNEWWPPNESEDE